jgi:hypothetical protein
MAISFKGAHFPPEVILMGVRWYVAYPLGRVACLGIGSLLFPFATEQGFGVALEHVGQDADRLGGILDDFEGMSQVIGRDRIVSGQTGNGPQGSLPLFQCWCGGVGQRCQRLLHLPQRPPCCGQRLFRTAGQRCHLAIESSKELLGIDHGRTGGVGRCRQLGAQGSHLVIGMLEQPLGVCHQVVQGHEGLPQFWSLQEGMRPFERAQRFGEQRLKRQFPQRCHGVPDVAEQLLNFNWLRGIVSG